MLTAQKSHRNARLAKNRGISSFARHESVSKLRPCQDVPMLVPIRLHQQPPTRPISEVKYSGFRQVHGLRLQASWIATDTINIAGLQGLHLMGIELADRIGAFYSFRVFLIPRNLRSHLKAIHPFLWKRRNISGELRTGGLTNPLRPFTRWQGRS